MNKLFFTTGVMLMLYSLVNAQQFQLIQIQGIVIEDDTGDPIDYVVCYLKSNDHIGDVTDSNGRFTLKFPRQFLSDTISIYLLGYEKLELPLLLLDLSQDTLLLTLERKSFLLDDIVVRAEGFDMQQLMINALKEIPKNYPNKKHQLTGLYRKVSTEDKLYTHLEEATLTVDDYTYNRNPDDIRIRLDAFRQTEDQGNYDSIYTGIAKKIGTEIGLRYNLPQNKIYRAYRDNYLRLHTKYATHFNLKSIRKHIEKSYDFELMNVIIDGKDTIYQIAYNDNPMSDQITGNTFFKINKSDFAVVEYQISSGYLGGYLLHLVNVKFQKVEGRYYPHVIRVIQPRFINRDPYDNEYDIETIWFDEVRTDGFKKIKIKEMLDPADTEVYKNTSYDSAFWIQSEYLITHPLEPHIKSALEKNGLLEYHIKQR